MARNSSIGGIFAELTLRDGKFTSGLKGAGAKLKAFGSSAKIYGAMAGAALGAGLLAGSKRIMAMGGELSDLSTQTGISVADLMKIQQAYKDNGKAAETAAKDINKMQRAIFEASEDPGGSTDYFSQMGLDAGKLMEMSAAQQFESIAKAINGIGNQTKKAALAMDIFGRSGGELLTVFAGSDFDSINRTLGDMPKLMQEFAAELDHADDMLSRLPNKSDQFFTGFTTGIISNVIPSLEMIDGYDFTQVGMSLGDSLSKGIMTAASHMGIFWNAAGDALAGDNFVDALTKYSAAQVAIENEDEERRADLRRKFEEDAAYEKARMEEYRTAPDYIDPAAAQPAAIMEQAAKSAGMTTGFDSYQSRGLSLSANPTADAEKKQLDIQIKIHRILERFTESDGALNWA